MKNKEELSTLRSGPRKTTSDFRRYHLFSTRGVCCYYEGSYPTVRDVYRRVNGESLPGSKKVDKGYTKKNTLVVQGRAGEYRPNDLMLKDDIVKLKLIDLTKIVIKVDKSVPKDSGPMFGISDGFDSINTWRDFGFLK